jgi:hypothetical protein
MDFFKLLKKQINYHFSHFRMQNLKHDDFIRQLLKQLIYHFTNALTHILENFRFI